MFKEYKAILENLRDVQDQLWRDSLAGFPGLSLPPDIDAWQQQILENVNDLMAEAVTQSLELQREWLEQWTDRVGDRKLKPKFFSELSAEARNSTQRWLDNQNQLWSRWMQLLGGSAVPGDTSNLELWDQAMKEFVQQQSALLNDWSEMSDFKKLSVDEATKLSNHIAKVMEKSIETQQRLWGQWFDELGVPVQALGTGNRQAEAKPAKKGKKGAAKPRGAADASMPSDDDLKRISGIGPALEKKLKENGISTLKQIAEWSDEDIARVEESIIQFAGRIEREQWVEQAKKLVS